MSNEQCAQCEQHAKAHSGNWLGFGPANARCDQCEQHVQMHAEEDGCAGQFMLLAVVAAVVTTAMRSRPVLCRAHALRKAG